MVKHSKQLGTNITVWLTRTDAQFCGHLDLCEEDYVKHKSQFLIRHTFPVKHKKQLGTNIASWLALTDAQFCGHFNLCEEDFAEHQSKYLT